MLKVAHISDCHFQNHSGRNPILVDVIKCSDFAVDVMQKESPDLIAIAGDLLGFYESEGGIPAGSPAHAAAIRFVKACAMVAPVVLIRGTTTHDEEGSVTTAFPDLQAAFPIYVTDRPGQILLYQDSYGSYHFEPNLSIHRERGDVTPKAVISCLPSITKAVLMTVSSGSITDTTKEVVNLLRDMFQGWGVVNDRAREEGVPSIMVGHGTMTGAVLSTGQVMIGKDLEFTLSDLELAHCDLLCFGHIHKAQYPYSGSITRLNFGETEAKGFFIHDLEKAGPGEKCRRDTKFVETPARSMVTKKVEGLPTQEALFDVKPGDSVRLQYVVAEDELCAIDEEALRAEAMARGAVDFKIDKTIVPKVKVRAEGISLEHTKESKLTRWGEITDTVVTPEILEKLNALESFVDPGELVEKLYAEGGQV
jgi:DNA repair protein SbcD/Mre11